MSLRLEAWMIGDDTDAPYHPLEPALKAMQEILQEEFDVTGTEDYDAFARLEPSRLPLCISYTDCWLRSGPTPEQTAGLLRYVAGGGGLLVVHTGISIQASYELAQMVGGKFTTHPPYQPLKYVPAGDGHPLMDGVAPFEMDEEPYMFELDSFSPRNVFLEYEFEGARIPAGWEQRYGLGRVVYLQPGHNASSFQVEPYRRLIRNSARWAASVEGGKE
ncbi:ThuA domain-containing protein [Paenibacillus sp.]|uniref:ThuA domain-containing protein n=1 Tax=Paenibacillus sp. TaxID=58172 RepID=UPI002D2DBBBA|nr:ThuA domain-containing protein [Paenibacillus sp.]HZG87764.1 ThuA domain-containing protein [Paenibacillus sp.]